MLTRSILLLVVSLVLQGCSTSPWQRGFVGVQPMAPSDGEAPVGVREVPWERLQRGLQELHEQAVNSDVPETEWPEERRSEAKAHLLRTLQVSQESAAVTVVGRSEFRTTSALRPERDGNLVELARKVGANEVVWSRRRLGTAETIIQEPVTTYSSGAGWSRRGRRGSFSETSTTWVPVVVAADEFAYVAYFLRR
jgi:hypothetical protein